MAWSIFEPSDRGTSLCQEVPGSAPAPRSECVKTWAGKCGFDGLAAHDLRRTFAKLSYKGKAALEQVKLALGHASVTTTERYLGCSLDLADAACDHLGLTISTAA